jgi:hypothetical protein
VLIDGSPVLLIEAKGLGENITDPRWANQVIGYAAVSGVSWVVLTDGDTWLLFNAGVSLPIEKKLFRTVKLAGDVGAAVSTLELLQRSDALATHLDDLWSVGQRDRSIREAIASLFSPENRDELIRALAPLTSAVTSDELADGLAGVHIDVMLGRPPESASPPTSDSPAATGTKGQASSKPRRRKMSDAEKRITLQEMMDAGVVLIGQRLTARYRGETFEATVGNSGDVIFEGRSYSPSGAGRAAKLRAQPGASESTVATQGMDFWYLAGEAGAPDRKLLDVRADLARGR